MVSKRLATVKLVAPGRARGLRPSSPLRTVRDSFPSYGSSLPKGLPLWGSPLISRLSHQLCDTSWQPQCLSAEGAHTGQRPCSFAFLPWCDSSSVLATGHPPDVCSLSGRANLEPVSIPLQDGIRFFQHLKPASPTACLTVSPA